MEFSIGLLKCHDVWPPHIMGYQERVRQKLSRFLGSCLRSHTLAFLLLVTRSPPPSVRRELPKDTDARRPRSLLAILEAVFHNRKSYNLLGAGGGQGKFLAITVGTL